MNSLDYPLSYHSQFILKKRGSPPGVPGDWSIQPLNGGWNIACSPALHVKDIVEPNGRNIGVIVHQLLLEHIRLQGECVQLTHDEMSDENRLHEFLTSLVGRFVVVLITNKMERVYPSAGATLACVFSKERERVASTATLAVMDEVEHAIFSSPNAVFPNTGKDLYYPCDLTAIPDVRRLLPNFYVDLRTWKQIRFWPAKIPERVHSQEKELVVEIITQLLKRYIKTIVKSYAPIYMSLTAGKDTRVLLACAKDYIEDITFVTFDHRHYNKSRNHVIDVDTARRIAKAFKLNHKILRVEENIPEQLELWHLQTIGFSAGAFKVRDFYQACKDNLDSSGAFIYGFGGEIVRGGYQKKEDLKNTEIQSEEILARLGLPYSDLFDDAIKRWTTDLIDMDRCHLFDMAYIEQGWGSFVSPRFYGAAEFKVLATPFASYEIFENAMRLPLQYRQAGTIASGIILESWRELLRFRFNDHISRPKRIAERLRWKSISVLRKIGVYPPL